MRKTQWKKQLIAASMGTVLLFSSTAQAFAATSPSDIQGHWAQTTLAKWVQEGKIKGYQDGTLKPNKSTTRAELIAMVNQALQLKGDQEISYKDVSSNKWYYSALKIAVANQYIGGYEDQTFRPNEEVTREQLAVILARLLQLTVSDSAQKYQDTKSLPAWSRGLIGAILDQGIMSVNAKGQFQPNKAATRAEVMVVLDRVSKLYSNEQSITLRNAGTYGPVTGLEEVKGDVNVQAGGVILRNYSIDKNLNLQAAIAEGDVDLQGVTVKGSTVINGGGPNSIRIADSVLAGVMVNKANGIVRIVASGNTTMGSLTLQSGAILTESQLTGAGFEAISISRTTPADAVIQLNGNFTDIEIDAPGITVQLIGGHVHSLHILSAGTGARVELPVGASIGTFQADASAQVTGKGAITRAVIKAAGVKLEAKPGQIELASGVTATVNGIVVSESSGASTVPGGSPGSGTGNEDGNGNGEQPVSKLTADEVFSSSASAQAGRAVILNKAPSSGTSAWFAPAGSSSFVSGLSMTQLIGDGTKVNMLAPSSAGTYKLYIVNLSGAVLTTSTSDLVVTGVVSNQQASSLYPVNRSLHGGVTVALTTAPEAGLTAWFAPSGTTLFTPSPYITQATDMSISAPDAEGEYRLFLVDIGGVARNTSSATLHIDNTAPKNDSVRANMTTKGGKSIQVGALGNDAVSAWFAPPGTTEFAVSSTMTQTTGTSLAAPLSDGIYRMYLIDASNNISLPSVWTLTVDNTSPTHSNTAPTSQNAVFNANDTVLKGSNVRIAALPTGVTAWFAPAVTTVFVEGPTMTKSSGTGSSATIPAPATAAKYKLFLIDAAGNVSLPSEATLTVNN